MGGAFMQEETMGTKKKKKKAGEGGGEGFSRGLGHI